MLASEIRDMADADIRSRIAELEEERFRLRFRGATEQLEEPLRLRAIRRDVARLKTILRQRELEPGSSSQQARESSRKAAATGKSPAQKSARKTSGAKKSPARRTPAAGK
jgi:large subunit ribosomal protein L29